MKRYKFLRLVDGKIKSEYGNFKWKIGQWYKHEGQVSLCNGGFHCSKEIGQAFSYVKGELLAEVEVRGKCDEQDDKDSWEEMKLTKVWYWNKENSVSIAIQSAELVLENYEKEYPNEKDPRLAIEAAKKWLAEPTVDNGSAARSAARSAWSAAGPATRSAAWYAAESAWYAAESAGSAAGSARSAWYAAGSAARSARSAWSAAGSAAGSARSAWSAAESAASKKIYSFFDEELKKLKKYDK